MDPRLFNLEVAELANLRALLSQLGMLCPLQLLSTTGPEAAKAPPVESVSTGVNGSAWDDAESKAAESNTVAEVMAIESFMTEPFKG